MVHKLVSEVTLLPAVPAAIILSHFQSQDSSDVKLYKSLKNKYLPPPPSPLKFFAIRLRSFRLHQDPEDRFTEYRQSIRCRIGSGLY